LISHAGYIIHETSNSAPVDGQGWNAPATGIAGAFSIAQIKHILQKHGWRIWAEAEIEKGATFFFTFESHTETRIGVGA